MYVERTSTMKGAKMTEAEWNDFKQQERMHIVKKLRALGESVQSIRKSLAELGVKGSRNDTQSCVIHNYLWDGKDNYAINYRSIRPFVNVYIYKNHGHVKIELYHEALVEFMFGFDHGLYPELVEGDN